MQTTEEASSLRYPTARAALTSGMGEMATKVLTIVLSVATARMLEPREVGLLGLSVIVIGVISMIGVYPETAAVAARGEASDGEYAVAASTIRAAINLLLLVALILVFPLVGGYLTGEDGGFAQLQELLKILIWVPVFEWVSGYAQILLQRRLDLNYLAWVQLAQPVIFVGLAIILLLEGQSYIGVAWANLVSSAATAVLVWGRLWQRGWLNWEGWPDKKVWRETALGSARMFVGGFGGYLGGRVDNLMVAGAIGPAAMSFYSMAWNASRTPAHVFAKAISFVLVPTIARIQDDPERVQRGLRECLRHSYLLLAPVCALLFVSAPLLVTFVLGAKWLPLVPVLRIMCFTVLVAPILFASTALLVGTGRAHLTGIATLAHLITLIVFVPFMTTRWGLVGAAYADMGAAIILTTVLCIVARAATRQISWAFLSAPALPIVAALLSGLLAWNVGAYITRDSVRLIGEAGSILLGYPFIILVFGGRARLLDFTLLLRGVLRRRAQGASLSANA